MGMILSRLVKSSSSQAAAAGRRPWAMSVSPELAGYVYVTAACAPHNQALPVLHEYGADFVHDSMIARAVY